LRLNNVVYSIFFFSSEVEIQSKFNRLNGKYKECIELCNEMTQRFSDKRPDCEEILKRKNSWALNEEELEINDELEDIIASKERENESELELTIYSMLRSEIDLIENSSSDSSSEAVNLKRSRSPEQRDQVSQQKRRTKFQNAH
jgi:hypothetical protein